MRKSRTLRVDALDEIKARDIVVLEYRKLTSLFDYMIVASAESASTDQGAGPQRRGKSEGWRRARSWAARASQTGEWVLVDLGGVIVHIMQPAIRDYYNLEQLWGGETATHAPPRHRGVRRSGLSDASADARASISARISA